MLMWEDSCHWPGVLLMRWTGACMSQSFPSCTQQSQGPFCDQWSQVGLLWSLQSNFPIPAMPWLGLMSVITGVGISWVFSTCHLKYHQLISFFVSLANFKLQFYILASDRLWISREGAMRTHPQEDVCIECLSFSSLAFPAPLPTQLLDTVDFGEHCVAYLVIWASSEGFFLCS